MGPTSNSLISSLEFMTRSSDLIKHICIEFGYYDKVQVASKSWTSTLGCMTLLSELELTTIKFGIDEKVDERLEECMHEFWTFMARTSI